MKNKMKNSRSCSVDLAALGNVPPIMMKAGPRPNVNKGVLKTRVTGPVRSLMKSFKRA